MTPKQQAKLEQERRDEALRRVMSTPEGREFVWRIITSVSGVFRDAFDLNERIEARNLGAASVGRALIAECQKVCPKEYLLMVQRQTNADLLKLEEPVEKEEA